MKKMVMVASCMSVLVGCQQQDLCVTKELGNEVLRVEAEISSEGVQSTRTSTSETGKVTFANNDQIGFYTPTTTNSGSWKLIDGNWSSKESYSWPDKATSYDFCAYYPFSVAENRTTITMPDLSTQLGKNSELSQYDFLVARCSASYQTKKGVVSFTKDEAFQHVYALLAVNLKTNKETAGSVLDAITLSCSDLLTSHTYHFGEISSEDGMTVNGLQKDELALGDLHETITSEGCQLAFIVNPLDVSEKLTISVDYSREEEHFTASTVLSAKTLQQGNLNKLNIIIKKAGLVIEGNTVQDWNTQNLEDVFVEESPVTE